jgi:hypothetical protein
MIKAFSGQAPTGRNVIAQGSASRFATPSLKGRNDLILLRFVAPKCGALSGLILGFNLPRALPKLMVLGLSPDAALRHLV